MALLCPRGLSSPWNQVLGGEPSQTSPEFMQCARRVPSKNVSSSQCLYVCCCDASQYASHTACRDTASLLHGNQGTVAAASPQLHPPPQLFLVERCGCGWRWINLPRVQCLVKLAEGVQVAEALLFMLNDFKVFHICLGPYWISTRLQVWSCLVTGNMVWPARGAPPVPLAPQNPNSSPLWPFAPWAAEALGAAGWGYRKNTVSLKGSASSVPAVSQEKMNCGTAKAKCSRGAADAGWHSCITWGMWAAGGLFCLGPMEYPSPAASEGTRKGSLLMEQRWAVSDLCQHVRLGSAKWHWGWINHGPSLSNLMASSSTAGGERGRGLCFKSRESSLPAEPSVGGREAMERNTHLLQVIREMHSQIDKLERENRALREELHACGLSAAVGGSRREMGSLPCPTEGSDASPAAPVDQAGTVMFVCDSGWAVTDLQGDGGELQPICLADLTTCSGLLQCPHPDP